MGRKVKVMGTLWEGTKTRYEGGAVVSGAASTPADDCSRLTSGGGPRGPTTLQDSKGKKRKSNHMDGAGHCTAGNEDGGHEVTTGSARKEKQGTKRVRSCDESTSAALSAKGVRTTGLSPGCLRKCLGLPLYNT